LIVRSRLEGRFWPSETNVFALVVGDDGVFVGGAFTSIGGKSRKYLAALDPGDGSVTRWDPSPDEVVRALAVSPDGSRFFVAGNFERISGGRRDLAEFDLTNGLLTSWRPIAPFSALTLALSGDGSTLYVAGEGAFFVFR
jgi:hypothetical protein